MWNEERLIIFAVITGLTLLFAGLYLTNKIQELQMELQELRQKCESENTPTNWYRITSIYDGNITYLYENGTQIYPPVMPDCNATLYNIDWCGLENKQYSRTLTWGTPR